MSRRGYFDRIVSKLVDLIYSKDKKYARLVILLAFFGLFLRLFAALNLDVFADDSIYMSQSAGIIQSGIISTHSNPPLFFYLTDFFYSIFGVTTFASRLLPLLMGAALIVVTFLITREFFNERVALFSAFFVTLSAFLVRMTFTEQTLVTLFFVLYATFFGLLYLKSNKMSWLLLSGVLFGLGFLTKYNAPFFVISFLLFGIYYKISKGEKAFTKSNIKRVISLAIVIVLFALPVVSFNYMIYKQNGITDVYVSRLLGVDKANQLYGSLAGQDETILGNLMKPDRYQNWNIVWRTDIILTLFALTGLFFFYKDKQKIPLVFFLIFLIVPFILQTGGSSLQKHFAFMHVLFAIPAGYALSKISVKFNKKGILYGVLIFVTVLMLVNLGTSYGTPKGYLSKSATSSAKSFVNSNVGDNDLVIFDSRIYTSTVFWLATPNHFITTNQFVEFYRINAEAPQKSSTKIWIVECAIDDCGWGWVNTNQGFNQSSEEILVQLKNFSKQEQKIEGYSYSGNELIGDKEKSTIYEIYSLNLPINQNLLSQTKRIQSFYFAPYLYENMDGYTYNYSKQGTNGLLHSLSLIIIYISMILAILFLLILFLFL